MPIRENKKKEVMITFNKLPRLVLGIFMLIGKLVLNSCVNMAKNTFFFLLKIKEYMQLTNVFQTWVTRTLSNEIFRASFSLT